jgi:SAM-dependent methyltransferase
MPDYAALHEPHAQLLRAALTAASPAGATAALDLAGGAGDKTPWLAACAAPGALVAGLDLDAAALRAPPAGERVVADAHALPLGAATLDLIWCVAALNLFAAPGQALAEARRALRPGGALIVATATERWVRLRRWPAALSTALGGIWQEGEQATPSLCPRPHPPADDLGGDLREQLGSVGLREVRLAAYLLDPPGLAPLAALLPLLGWETLRPYAEAHLGPAALAACAAIKPEEPEPLPVLLVATGQA